MSNTKQSKMDLSASQGMERYTVFVLCLPYGLVLSATHVHIADLFYCNNVLHYFYINPQSDLNCFKGANSILPVEHPKKWAWSCYFCINLLNLNLLYNCAPKFGLDLSCLNKCYCLKLKKITLRQVFMVLFLWYITWFPH